MSRPSDSGRSDCDAMLAYYKQNYPSGDAGRFHRRRRDAATRCSPVAVSWPRGRGAPFQRPEQHLGLERRRYHYRRCARRRAFRAAGRIRPGHRNHALVAACAAELNPPTRSPKVYTMKYVDGFITPVPNNNKDAFLNSARLAAKFSWNTAASNMQIAGGVEVPHGNRLPFPRAVELQEKNRLLFPDCLGIEEIREPGMQKGQQDREMQPISSSFDQIFDHSRRIRCALNGWRTPKRMTAVCRLH